MTPRRGAIRRRLQGLSWLGMLGLGVWGCAGPIAGTDAGKPGAGPADASPSAPSHAEVWAQNCGRCHNLRSPGEFSCDQWGIIVHHMSLRANLAAEDSRAILEFLRAAASAPPAGVGARVASTDDAKN
jgi:hypothetical protein